MPSTFDQTAWHVNHTRLVNRVLDRFESEGRTVSVEAQNQFTLVGRVATVGGRPDIIAVSQDSVTVCDAKTGQPRISDQVQVMAYMYAVPVAFPDYKGIPVGGLVIYFRGRRPLAGLALAFMARNVGKILSVTSFVGASTAVLAFFFVKTQTQPEVRSRTLLTRWLLDGPPDGRLYRIFVACSLWFTPSFDCPRLAD